MESIFIFWCHEDLVFCLYLIEHYRKYQRNWINRCLWSVSWLMRSWLYYDTTRVGHWSILIIKISLYSSFHLKLSRNHEYKYIISVAPKKMSYNPCVTHEYDTRYRINNVNMWQINVSPNKRRTSMIVSWRSVIFLHQLLVYTDAVS